MGEIVCLCWGEVREIDVVELKFTLGPFEVMVAVAIELRDVFPCGRIM